MASLLGWLGHLRSLSCRSGPEAALWQNGWIDGMARGHKTGGRQKGTPNKHKAEYDAKFAEAAGRATAALSTSEIASMMPLDVMPLAMRLQVECGQLRSAASIAEKAAPNVHPKMAPRAEEGGDHELTIKIIGGLPE
jgi:hypothetical protein